MTMFNKISIFDVVLFMTVLLVTVFHVCSISLNVTPNYVQKGSTLTLTCNTTYTTYRTTFNRDSYGKLASIISNTSGCYDFDTSMKCSDCSCDNNSISLLYKPQSTSNYSFNCTNDQEGNSDTVSVRAKAAPSYIVLDPSTASYNITAGTNLQEIICSSPSCWPACILTWEGPVPTVPYSKNGRLILQNITRSATGKYTCNASNEVGSLSSEPVYVNVQYGPQMTKIYPATTSYQKVVNSNLNSITCSADCKPFCTFEWIFPDGTTGTSNVLSLSRIQKSHHGTFKCKVRNGIGSEEISFSLDVQYSPENLTLSPGNSLHTISENRDINIACFATCNPQCNYSWTGPSWSSNGDVLQLRSISKSNDGKYRCKAENVHGTIYSDYITINVIHSPSEVTLSPTTINYTKQKGESLGPISCTANCNPSCQYKWIYPDGSLHSTETLSITNLSATEHHGDFRCQITNSQGTTTKYINVVVNYKPETTTLTPSTTTQVVSEFRGFTLTCKADCRPQCSYTWLSVHGPNIFPSSSQLRFSTIRRKDSGQYYCRAQNNYGSKYSSTVTIIVQTLPTKVENMSVICTGPDSAAISWIPDLSVVPEQNFTISYWKKGVNLKSNKAYTKDSNHQFLYILDLDELTSSSEYNFQILSYNGISTARSNTISCLTPAPLSNDSASNAELIGGIVMISLSVLIIAAVIVFFVLRKYSCCKGSKEEDDSKSFCGSCWEQVSLPCFSDEISFKLPRSGSRKKNENSKNQMYVNFKGQNKEMDKKGNSDYTSLERSNQADDTNYAALKMAQIETTITSKEKEKPYQNVNLAQEDKKKKKKNDNIKTSNVEHTIKASEDTIQMKTPDQNKEKVALKPPVNKGGKPKTAPKPNQKHAL